MKYKSPLNGKELWVSQTYHISGGNKAIDLGNTPVGTPVYAMANGTVEVVSTSLGSYLTLKVENSKHKLFYVHIYKFTVKAGQKVKVGDKIGEIAPESANGGFSPHLHIGLQPEYGLMDYMDRKIAFRTKYQDIKKVWFKGEDINWGLFKDLSYESNASMGFKKGDIVIITGVQNIRQAPAGKITGDSIVGQLGIIHDNPRQAIADGKNYTWYDIHIINGGSGWFADVGKFRLAKPEEILPPAPVPAPKPEPTSPPQGPVIPPEPSEWEERYNEALGEIKGLTEELRASQKEVKRLEVELEQRGKEFSELRERCDGLEEKNKMLEEERLLLQEHQEKELKAYRRWDWLIKFLNAIIPVK